MCRSGLVWCFSAYCYISANQRFRIFGNRFVRLVPSTRYCQERRTSGVSPDGGHVTRVFLHSNGRVFQKIYDFSVLNSRRFYSFTNAPLATAHVRYCSELEWPTRCSTCRPRPLWHLRSLFTARLRTRTFSRHLSAKQLWPYGLPCRTGVIVTRRL